MALISASIACDCLGDRLAEPVPMASSAVPLEGCDDHLLQAPWARCSRFEPTAPVFYEVTRFVNAPAAAVTTAGRVE